MDNRILVIENGEILGFGLNPLCRYNKQLPIKSLARWGLRNLRLLGGISPFLYFLRGMRICE